MQYLGQHLGQHLRQPLNQSLSAFFAFAFLTILTMGLASSLSAGGAGSQCAPEEAGFIQKSLNTICSKDEDPKKTIFVLIDGSDPYDKKSVSWIKANVFNKRIIKPSAEGDEVIFTHFDKGALSAMRLQRLCAPKPNDQISYIFDAPQKIKRANHSFYCVVEEIIPDRMFAKTTRAPKSLIMEAISEVSSNPKLIFSERTGKRVLVLVSDLFQNSNSFSFHKICKKKCATCPVLCPTYKKAVESTPVAARYLEAVLPKLRADDEIVIFNANVKGKLDRSAADFWRGFFEASGVKSGNISFKYELEK